MSERKRGNTARHGHTLTKVLMNKRSHSHPHTPSHTHTHTPLHTPIPTHSFTHPYPHTHLCFDSDAALPLHLKFVKDLLVVAGAYGASGFEDAVCDGALAMINVCNDGKVANVLWCILFQAYALLIRTRTGTRTRTRRKKRVGGGTMRMQCARTKRNQASRACACGENQT